MAVVLAAVLLSACSSATETDEFNATIFCENCRQNFDRAFRKSSNYTANQVFEKPADVTFLTSHFSTLKFAKKAKHYVEIEAAIMSNLINPALAEVVVWYENYGPDNCTALRKRLEAGLAKAHYKMVVPFSCWHRTGQPTYWEMFQYASTQPDGKFKGSVVVMSNADCVTDLTVTKLSGIRKHSAVTISITAGLQKRSRKYLMPFEATDREPLWKKQWNIYVRTTGFSPCHQPSRCSNRRYHKGVVDSWDAYAFRTPLPELNDTYLDPRVYMNMMGAENRAGAALVNAGLSGRTYYGHTMATTCNVCPEVSLVTFHCTNHTHRGGKFPTHFLGKKDIPSVASTTCEAV